MVKMIAAVGKNLELGKDNSLMWSISEDMKFFRTTTAGHTVVMGRLTYESIGRPLPKRRNIVISRNPDYKPEGVETAMSLETALEMCEHNCFIIGGAAIYKLGLEYADEIILTEIDNAYPEADVYFPEFNKDVWNREVIGESEENGLRFSFVKYSKKENA